jgi:precorrin-4 methylase
MKLKVTLGKTLPLAALALLFLLVSVLPAAAQGRLYIVSLGIGDRDNMTIRAQKTIMAADVILTMKFNRQKLADMLQGKEVHEIGHALFKKNCPHRQQDPSAFVEKESKVRRLVREAVAAGKTVAVLDGGDPTIYGPNAGFFTEFADLDLKVIPGVSCFNAANAALKRGITGGIASRSVILTGGIGLTKGYTCLDTIDKLSETQSTMVFFTMRVKLPQIVESLKKNYPGDTPVAIVCQAGYQEKEKVIQATLDTILESIKGRKLPFEHLVYVGDFLK